MHFDLWWKGVNIATDAGTYSYNRTEPWTERFNVLSETQFHNTVTVDGVSQMERASPFLWLPWLSGDVIANTSLDDGVTQYWEGQHDGYERLEDPVSHRRAVVRLGGEHWIVLDYLEGQRAHDYRLQWLLADLPYTAGDDEDGSHSIELSTPHGPYSVGMGSSQPGGPISLVRADPKSPRGWRSPYYMAMEPALSIVQERHVASVWFWTVFSPGNVEIEQAGSRITCDGEQWSATLHHGSGSHLVSSITFEAGGQVYDQSFNDEGLYLRGIN